MQDYETFKAPIGIVSALSFELSHFNTVVQDQKKQEINGKTYAMGKLLFRDEQVVMTGNAGVGKVQCAIALMTLIERFKPREIFLLVLVLV